VADETRRAPRRAPRHMRRGHARCWTCSRKSSRGVYLDVGPNRMGWLLHLLREPSAAGARLCIRPRARCVCLRNCCRDGGTDCALSSRPTEPCFRASSEGAEGRSQKASANRGGAYSSLGRPAAGLVSGFCHLLSFPALGRARVCTDDYASRRIADQRWHAPASALPMSVYAKRTVARVSHRSGRMGEVTEAASSEGRYYL